ncbi:hypothetical protein [Prochlorococcus sp. MIT 1307]|uniref:hypothetical protein n=1 Tax=Prochlorococcus sp. MIT 1307 TaxID=3096219 RepID=UPI002A765D05|nr:hypothetical protein [Prochlorococcus sp. MIT 1307]
MTLTWAFALMLSFGLRAWGAHHPDPFIIRPYLVFGLLFGPSIVLGFWLYFVGFRKVEL